jgi:hypothetical protein
VEQTSATTLMTHIAKKDHLPGMTIKVVFHLFPVSDTIVTEPISTDSRGRRTKSVSLAPTSVPATPTTVSFDLADQVMDSESSPASNSEVSSPA